MFGPDSPQGRWHGDVVLANVSKAWTAASLTVFNYYLDIDEAPTQSSDTVGARLAGASRSASYAATYTLSYAHADRCREEHGDYTDGYYLLEGGLEIKKISCRPRLRSARKRRQGRVRNASRHPARVPGLGRQVPDDPDAGHRRRVSEARLLARHARRVQELERARLAARLHGRSRLEPLRRELDLQLVAKTAKMALTLKYADYNADTLYTDTTKLWLSVDYAF